MTDKMIKIDIMVMVIKKTEVVVGMMTIRIGVMMIMMKYVVEMMMKGSL